MLQPHARKVGPTDAALLIMMSLAGGARHGYGIMKDIESFCGLILGAGTLYGSIARLEERGLIEALESDEPRKRPYQLTSAGRAALQAQLDALEIWTRVGRSRLAPA
jgi:DNA-binding PadR family transcriptional regulator